jgi:hypothetical protein
MAMHRIKKKSFWNKLGLFTKDQVEEVQDRADELWHQLNEACCVCDTYWHNLDMGIAKLREQGDDISAGLAEQCRDRMKECADKCVEVMFSDEL